MKKKLCFMIMFMMIHGLSFGQCFQKTSIGVDYTLAIKSDGTLWAWGYNGSGQLGNGTTISKSSPVQIGTDTDWEVIQAGYNHAAAIKTNGTLWMWGSNNSGELGDGTNGPNAGKMSPTQIGTSTQWKSISLGYNTSFATKTDGTLWAWGYNNAGILGDGTTINKNIPVQIGNGTNWRDIAAGFSHSLAIKTDGTLWTWGSNGSGQLGHGGSSNKMSPTQVGTATDWQSIDAGNYFSMATKVNGTLWLWGNNDFGQLGDGSLVKKDVPTQVGTATDWKNTFAGARYGFAIKTNGTLWSWGDNDSGQLGNGILYSSVLVPTQIGTETNWQNMSTGMGGRHTFVTKTNGTLWGCGYNGNKQFNTTNISPQSTFIAFACPTSSLAVDEISASSDHFKVYPNPVLDRIHISNDKKISSLAIYAMTGQKVFTKEINTKEADLELSFLRSGTYWIEVRTAENTIQTLKIIKR